MRILLADADRDHREALRALLRGWGHDVTEAIDAKSAAAVVVDRGPDVVLSDPLLPGSTLASELTELVRRERPESFVILLTRPGAERAAMLALRAGAANFVSKPVEHGELRRILEKCRATIAARDEERMVPALVEERSVTLRLPNELRLAARVSDFLLRDVAAVAPGVDIATLTLGLQEMLQNAVEHGNLGITYDEKSAALEHGTLAELVAARQAESARAGRCVHVMLRQDRAGLVLTVRDEGTGFDWRTLPDPLTPEGMLQMHGRGIYLTRFAYDSVDYNERGNQVTLTKTFPPADAGAGRSPAS